MEKESRRDPAPANAAQDSQEDNPPTTDRFGVPRGNVISGEEENS